MRRAIVHIGWPRTGTTTFQRVLFHLREDLARQGILYPELTPHSATQPHLNHQYLGEAFDGRRPLVERAELLESLAQQVRRSTSDVVLVSYEGLCWSGARWPFSRGWNGRHAPLILRDLFAAQGFAMETLVTLKPQSEYANSAYTLRAQWLKESRSFPSYVQALLGSRHLDYHALLQPWAQASEGRVWGVPLRDHCSDAPFITRIITELGLGDRMAALWREEDRKLVDNRSPGPVAVEVCRYFGRWHRQDGAREATRFVERRARELGWDEQAFQGVDLDLKARIEAACQASNAALAMQLWRAPWDRRMKAGRAGPVNEIAGRARDQAQYQAVHQIVAETARMSGLKPHRLRA